MFYSANIAILLDISIVMQKIFPKHPFSTICKSLVVLDPKKHLSYI